ncbi:alpha/beta hydrolase family protein [Sphingomonas xinjiangensis]|uniref:alpha/beta hydrolase family protein n=1 Tax=Sphingomonas xinjiangensis TaxID=643568 RepID=UPI00161852CA|nr:alpha/beta fold hydrolase [Sphingomonas xinjiangensis]
MTRDPPIDASFPAETLAQAIPSGGVNLNALLYTAAGAGRHPTVLLLHGLPGNEQNVDLAQSMRRAGWNVLTCHYRGSWGSPGAFSFAHCIEDAEATFDWLRREGAIAGSRIDPEALVVIGHSMGGFIAGHVAARYRSIRAAALISAADLGSAFGDLPNNRAVAVMDDNVGTSMGLHILSGTSPQALAAEVASNADRWRLPNFAGDLAGRPLLLCTSDDGFTSGSDALVSAIGAAGKVSQAHFTTDHSYSDHRISLQREVLRWLREIQNYLCV